MRPNTSPLEHLTAFSIVFAVGFLSATSLIAYMERVRRNAVLDHYKNVLLATACDGTLATTAQFTSIRVVCNNTLAVALGASNGAIKVRHNTAFDAQSVKRQLGISVSTWNSFMYQMKGLSERKVKTHEAMNYLSRVFSDEKKEGGGNASDCTLAKVMALFDGRGRGAELTSAKGTAFGLLNSVTEFADHERRARSTDHRLESAWFGQGASLKKKALEQALMMIS